LLFLVELGLKSRLPRLGLCVAPLHALCALARHAAWCPNAAYTTQVRLCDANFY
ncbi:hypothetical protein HAX54_020160, partial [Datura stramonium]|nr:hypothetical protein [Datura stramonium]